MCAGNMGCLCLNWAYTAYEWIFVCANVYLPLVCFLWVHPVCISVSSVSTLPTNWLECGFVFMCPVYQAHINVCVCVCGVSEQECYLQLGWPLWALQSSRPGRCYCGPQPWSDIWCLAWGSGWWPASPLDDWYSRLAPWWGGWGWVARRQVTEQLIILTLNYPEGFV